MPPLFEQGLGLESERVMRALREKIATGRYPAGSRLPSERDLCQAFGLSRTTVRRAISRLVADGWITARHGSGLYVNAVQGVAPGRPRSIAVMFSMNLPLLAMIQKHALEHDYLVTAFPRQEMGWAPDRERAFLERIRQERHHALLAFCTPLEPRNDDMLAQLEREGMRVLHVEHYREEPPGQGFILPDYHAAGALAVQRARASGYQPIITVRMANDWPGALILEKGVAAALARLRVTDSLSAAPFIYPRGAPARAASRREIIRFLQQLPRRAALVCSSVGIAAELLAFARQAGRPCPADLGIIGLPYLDYDLPTTGIDTIEFDRAGYLARALDRVLAPQWAPCRDWVPPRFVARGSTAKSRTPRREARYG